MRSHTIDLDEEIASLRQEFIIRGTLGAFDRVDMLYRRRERLRIQICGACAHVDRAFEPDDPDEPPTYTDGGTCCDMSYLVGEDQPDKFNVWTSSVHPHDCCHFTPSRWRAYWEAET